MRLLLCCLLCVGLVACSTNPGSSKSGRVYKLANDVEPVGGFDASSVPVVTPVWEALSPQGNKSPYVVRGKQYQIMPANAQYKEEGYASWYGLKFHDELTSNGERYDMYSFSAAHKSLPLPSYVKVTNLDNNEVLVVRVNDRGPFHSDRIIDLSYASAIRLGFKDKGTARVKIERLMPQPSKRNANSVASKQSGVAAEVVNVDRLAPFVQVAAFGSRDLAEAMRERVGLLVGDVDSFLGSAEGANGVVYRVRLGPFPSLEKAQKVRAMLTDNGVGKPQIITRSIKARGN